ncbi:MAG: hypothetical protein ACI8UO_000548 [Verrucomicrobiales bacterium]
MKFRRKRLLLAVCVLLFAATGFFAWWAMSTPWFRSATAVRTGNPTNDSFLQEANNPGELIRPTLPREFDPVSMDRVENEIWLQRVVSQRNPYHGRIGAETIRGKNGVAKLPGDLDLRLVAAALFVPNYSPRPQFFDPTTGKDLSRQQLLALSEDARDFQPNVLLSMPTLRLIFDGSAAPLVRDRTNFVFDARTKWLVAHGGPIDSKDGFVVTDIQISLWHDTELDVVLDVPCGNPESVPIPRTVGEQIAIGESIRVQVGGFGAGRVKALDQRGLTFDVVGNPETEGFVIARISPSIWAKQCQIGIVGEPPAERAWLESVPRFQPATISRPVDEISEDDLQIFWYPKRARVWFRVAAIPAMPNPRSVRNLFNVRIPQVTVNDREGFEAMLKLAADATQHDDTSDGIYWRYGVGEGPPAGYFPRRWENVKASQLLSEMLKFHQKGNVRIDNQKQYLIYEELEEKTWWQDTKSWFRERWPF